MQLKGIVISGLNKAVHFVKLYETDFKEILGFLPFPGTLNLQLSQKPKLAPKKRLLLQSNKGGAVDCYRILINNTYEGALIIPHKSTHPTTLIELIAPICLRDALNLHDGDELTCELV